VPYNTCTHANQHSIEREKGKVQRLPSKPDLTRFAADFFKINVATLKTLQANSVLACRAFFAKGACEGIIA
jgi:hypothetical protein